MTALRPASFHVHRPGFLLVPVNLLALPERIDALGEAWHVKTEHHVTALDVGWLADRLGRAHAEVWAATAATLDEVAAGPITLGDELRRAERGEERTLVVMCELAGLAELHRALGARLGAELELELPPAHVTLYADAPGRPGIGLHDAAELDALTRVLGPDEAAEVRAAAGL